MTNASHPSFEQSQAADFIAEAMDFLSELEVMIGNMRSGALSGEDAVHRINRIAHSIKGMAAVANFSLISRVSHKMEDYAAGIKEINSNIVEDFQIYADTIRDLVDDYAQGRAMPDDGILEQLPEKPGAAHHIHVPGDFTVTLGESIIAMLVVPDKTTYRFLTRELNSSGIQTEWSSESGDALQKAMTVDAKFVLISAVLDAMSGVDVILALRSIPKTKGLKLGLLSSYDRGHQDLAALPDDVPLVRKSHFSDDIADALVQAKVF